MLIITDSTAAKETNETSSNSYNHHHRKLGTHNFIMKAGKQKIVSGSDTPNEQCSKQIYTLGNTIAGNRKSLNVSQKFNDSSINELTLGKTGKINNLNLSSLLKYNILDEDGIEDLHFYFVSFNQHKHNILKLHENVKHLTDEQAQALKNKKGS